MVKMEGGREDETNLCPLSDATLRFASQSRTTRENAITMSDAAEAANQMLKKCLQYLRR